MRRPGVSSKWLVKAVAVVVIPVCVGCKGKFFNTTFINDRIGAARLVEIAVTLKIRGAAMTFPAMDDEDGWYNDDAPTITALGDDEFKLTWSVNLASMEEIHLGGTFAKKRKVTPVRLDTRWSDGWSVGGPLLNVSTQTTAGDGLALALNNVEGSPGDMTLEEMHWAATPTALPLDDLVWGDPELESLDWEPVPLALPMVLSAGAPAKVLDLPDAEFIDNMFGLIKFRISSPDVVREGVYQTTIAIGSVPALDTWALVATGLLLLAGVALRNRRNRRHIAPARPDERKHGRSVRERSG